MITVRLIMDVYGFHAELIFSHALGPNTDTNLTLYFNFHPLRAIVRMEVLHHPLAGGLEREARYMGLVSWLT
jgi:hypothetical protein